MDHRQPSLVPRFCELIVEGGKGDVLPVILIEGRVVVPRDKKDYMIGTTVVHRSKTHRAGMREDIERTANEMFRTQLGRGFSDRTDLGVRGRIMRLATRFTPSATTTPSLTMRQEEGPPTGLHIRFRQLNQPLLEIHDDLF